MRLKLAAAAMLCALLCVASPAQAQVSSNETTVTLSAELLESLTVVVLPGLVNFTLSSGSATNAGSTSVLVTTTWVLTLTRSSLKLYAYFSDPAAALAHTLPGNTVDIPSSRFQIAVNGGSFAAVNQSVTFGPGSGGLQLFNQALTPLNIAGLRADTLTFNVDLSSYTLPVDIYTGTLRLRAQATP